jgi:signal transduction histidine kinase
VKFTDEGGVTLALCDELGDDVCVEARDTGRGIAAEDLAGVFEEFQQAGPRIADAPKGTGLGLPISRKLARLMGGDLTASSDIGEGSVFRLTLRRA